MDSTSTAAHLKRDGGPALYQQVADCFRARINSGTWLAGDRLPAIDSLTKEFDVARITIRDALKLLTSEGLVESARGKGTTVTKRAMGHRPVRMHLDFNRFVETLRNDRPDLNNFTIFEEVPNLSKVEGEPADRYTCIERSHIRDDVRYCHIRLYLDQSLYKQMRERFKTELALPVLFELVPPESVRICQKVHFGKCGNHLAKLLHYPFGDPVAHITRSIRSNTGKIIYYAEVKYRADLLQIETESR